MKKQHLLFNSRLFAQNFLYIGSIMLLFFAAFSLITYKRSMNIMTREFTASAENQLSITAKTVDTQFSDSRYIFHTFDHLQPFHIRLLEHTDTAGGTFLKGQKSFLVIITQR